MTQIRHTYIPLLIILILSGGVRIAVVSIQPDQLQQDRDAYLAIAENLATGHGFSSSNRATEQDIQPTAFRPPLYPCLLSIIYFVNAGPIGIGIVQIILGVLTVWLTWQTGKCLQLEWSALIAAAIVATDPVLLQYTAYAMTEVLATFLTSLLLFFLVTSFVTKTESTKKESPISLSFWTGIVWGLCILCRPTYLAFFCLWIAVRLSGMLIRHFPLFKMKSFEKRQWCQIKYLAAGIMLTISPWLIRNLIVFQAPVFSTTHGGYTLLLGNNPVFYKEVVQKPWGTVWSGESLHTWQQSLEQQLADHDPSIESERARDRWMYQRAKYNIADQPELFVQSCILRFKRFWNISPLTRSTLTSTSVIVWSIAGYYTLILVGCFGGIIMVIWNKEQIWEPLIWIIVSFTLVHLFYWTNMRMRAPLVPAIALLSVYGWSQTCRFLKFVRPAKQSLPDRHNS